MLALALASVGDAVPTAYTSGRRAVLWLVPYDNVTTAAAYETMWAQLGVEHHPGILIAGSAYALKANNASLGYADTVAGEALYGVVMEQAGYPALRSLGYANQLLGMVYVTHSAAIDTMLANPAPFIAELVAKAEEQQLAGFDIDFEPQGLSLGGRNPSALVGDHVASAHHNTNNTTKPSTFMDFLTTLAGELHAVGRFVTIDVGDCSASGFSCEAAATVPGFLAANLMDSFGASSVSMLKPLRETDGVALGGAKWNPGFEPGNLGPNATAELWGWLGSAAACDRTNASQCPGLSTWQVHEWNVGPQPQWFFDELHKFLDAPTP